MRLRPPPQNWWNRRSMSSSSRRISSNGPPRPPHNEGVELLPSRRATPELPCCELDGLNWSCWAEGDDLPPLPCCAEACEPAVPCCCWLCESSRVFICL